MKLLAPTGWRAPAFVLLAFWALHVGYEATLYFLHIRGRFHVESKLLILVTFCVALALAGKGDAAEAAPEPAPLGRRGPWLIALSVGAAVLLYWPAYGIGFLSDDFVLVAEAEAGRALTPHAGRFFRPVALYVLGGLALPPTALHLLNATLHGLNAALVFGLARAVAAPASSALAAGALFLSFPASVEAVAWCSGIQDLLAATCGLVFVLSWGLRGSLARRLVLSLTSLLLGLGTKETSVMFPAMALVTWLGSPLLPRRELMRLTIPTAALALAYAAWRVTGLGVVEGYAAPPSPWLLKEILVRAFGALACPWHSDLGAEGVALGIAVGILLPLLLVAVSWTWHRDRAALGRAVRLSAWVLLSVAPVYSFLYVSRELGGSRYVYLAEAGWAILFAELLAAGLGALTRRRGPLVASWALSVAISVVALRVHLRPWQEAARLRETTLAAAVERIAALGCRRSSFANLPDSVRGAYVFRNGFEEALRRIDLPAAGVRGRSCHLTWNGSTFEARESPALETPRP